MVAKKLTRGHRDLSPIRLRVAQHEAVAALALRRGADFKDVLAEVIERGLDAVPDEDRPEALLERAILGAIRRASARAVAHRGPRDDASAAPTRPRRGGAGTRRVRRSR